MKKPAANRVGFFEANNHEGARAQRRRTKGLPEEPARLALAKTYVTTQRRLWPKLVKLGGIPTPTPKLLTKMSDRFQSAFLTAQPATPELPEGLTAEIACAYLRYSDDQSNPRSLDQQLNNVLERAAREGVYVPWDLIFADAAVTGRTAARTGYQMAKSVIAEPATLMILIDEIGRASRDAIEALELGKYVQGLEKVLIGATDGFDSRTTQSKMTLMIFAMVQEWFIDQLKEKVKRGMDDAFKEGRNIFGAALGYKLVPKHDKEGNLVLGRNDKPQNLKVLDENESSFVIQIFELFAVQRRSPEQIARLLNEKKAGGQDTWDRRRVVQVLTRETYVGIEYYGQSYRVLNAKDGTVTMKHVPRDKWKRREVPKLRIVSDELWAKAQDRLAEIRRAFKRRNEKRANEPGREEVYPTVLIRPECGYCFSRLILGRAGRYASLFCMNGKDRKRGCKLTSYKTVRILDDAVLGHLREKVLTSEIVERIVREANTYLAAEASRPAENTQPIRAEIKAITNKRDRLLESLETGVGKPASIVALIAQHDRKLKALHAKLKEMEARNATVPVALKMKDVTAILEDLRGVLNQDVAMAAPVLHRLLGPVKVKQEKVEGQRGATWFASFTVNLVPVIAELTRKAACPGADTWEFLHTRGWTIRATATIPVRKPRKHEILSAAAFAMAKKGSGIETIASVLGTSWQTAHDAVEFARCGGVPRADAFLPIEPKDEIICDERAKEIVRLREVENWSFQRIARDLNISHRSAVASYDRLRPEALLHAGETGTKPKRGQYRHLSLPQLKPTTRVDSVNGYPESTCSETGITTISA